MSWRRRRSIHGVATEDSREVPRSTWNAAMAFSSTVNPPKKEFC